MRWLEIALLLFGATLVRAEAPPFGPEASTAVKKLRVFCAACHAVGKQRFIYSPDDEEVWRYLHSGQAPVAKKVWVLAIRDVLSWPSETPPPFEPPPHPDRDWMPKGIKRTQLAADRVDGRPTRAFLVGTLSAF